MENISVGLKWVIGVIVTILIIAAGISIYLVINGYFSRAQEQTLSQSQLISQAEFSSYDNRMVSGHDVLNASTRYFGRPNFSIHIRNNESITNGFFADSTHGRCYATPTDNANLVVDVGTSVCTGGLVTVATMQDPTTSIQYVNPTATFQSRIYRDNNGEVVLIDFIQN